MVSPGMPNMQMLNFNNILNVKDSRWLQLEVCREFQRNKCSRPDTECKFAHPPVNVEVQNGRVTACYDSIKGRCNREKPPCKYFHPPQHLKDQLLINGRNHLALKNAFMTQITQGLSPGTQLVHGTLPVEQQQQRSWYSWFERNPHPLHLRNEVTFQQQSSPYLASIPTMANFNPYIASSPVMAVGMTEAVQSPLSGVVPQAVVPTQKAFPGMGVPYKRPAPDKSGVPVYQPTGNAAYQQALMQQLGGQSYVPVSCEYGGNNTNLLALPPPNAEVSTHSPPAIHNAASSSAQPETPSSSSSISTSSSSSSFTSTSYPPPPSFPTSTLSSSSSSSAGKASSLHVVSSSASPSLPATPVNVISYTGYALNKGLRAPPVKPPVNPFIPSPVGVSPGIPSTYNPGAMHHHHHPGAIPSMGGMGMGMAPLGMGFQMPGGLTMMSPPQGVASGIGGLVQGGMPMMASMGGAGAGMPSMISPQLMYSQYPSSSVYLPQLTALSNNPQISWAQAGEQPYKKLKTS